MTTPNPKSVYYKEPNLLIPGKKPVFATRVDRTHSIGSACRYAALSHIADIASSATLTEQGNTVRDIGVFDSTQFFRNQDITSAAETGWTFNTFYPEFWGSHDRTFVIVAYVGTWKSSSYIISYGENATNTRWTWRAGDLAGGPFRLEIQGSGYNSSIAPSDNSNFFGACCSGSDLDNSYFYYNGTTENMSGSNTINTSNTAYPPAIGSSVDAGTTKAQSGLSIFAVYGFAKKLSIGELDELYADPYQFLIPA